MDSRSLPQWKSQRRWLRRVCESGGGDLFPKFLRDEVIPHVDRTYRTKDYRLFAGHSLGGIMVHHALMTMPETFDGYLAQSPSLEWEATFVDHLGSFLEKRESLPQRCKKRSGWTARRKKQETLPGVA